MGGDPCLTQDGLESESCVVLTCPVDGNWGPWSKWSYCNVTCGKGHKIRTRSCNKPKPENGVVDCNGLSSDIAECKAVRECPMIRGGWSEWSRWSGCHKKCGKGQITRIRTCTNPKPENGGTVCNGDSVQQRSCYLKKCPNSSLDPMYLLPTAQKLVQNSSKDQLIKQSQKEEESLHCTGAPYVLGFYGPLIDMENSIEKNSAKLSQSIYYKCYHGKVLDIYSNRRYFSVPCLNTTPEFEYPKEWPRCVSPKNCIGPSNLQDHISFTNPKRDAKILSTIEYKCNHANSQLLHASCFFDGSYRYPRDLCDNSDDISNKNLCGAEVILEKPNEYGWWIQNSTEHSDGSENQNNCTMRISLSNNISLKIGIESILGYSMLINSRAFQMPIEVIQEENFSLQFKKSLNGNFSHYIKLQYITYE